MEMGLQCPTLMIAISVIEITLEVDGGHWLLIPNQYKDLSYSFSTQSQVTLV